MVLNIVTIRLRVSADHMGGPARYKENTVHIKHHYCCLFQKWVPVYPDSTVAYPCIVCISSVTHAKKLVQGPLLHACEHFTSCRVLESRNAHMSVLLLEDGCTIYTLVTAEPQCNVEGWSSTIISIWDIV